MIFFCDDEVDVSDVVVAVVVSLVFSILVVHCLSLFFAVFSLNCSIIDDDDDDERKDSVVVVVVVAVSVAVII